MPEMKYIRQPEGSSLCGQTCVAMVAGVSLEESIKVFGTRSGTRTRQLVAALKTLRVNCGNKLIRLSKKNKKTDLCIVHLRIKGVKNGHWTVWNKNHFLDPGIEMYVVDYGEMAKECSFLPIYLQGGDEQ